MLEQSVDETLYGANFSGSVLIDRGKKTSKNVTVNDSGEQVRSSQAITKILIGTQ